MAVVLTLSHLVLTNRSISAQTERVVDGRPTCAECRVEVRPVARLGERDGPGALASRPYHITRDSRGRFYVVTPETPNEAPLVFDAQGRFLARLGRSGDGPGEFRSASWIGVGPNDSVYVIDQVTARLTVLDSEYNVVRTARVPPNIWTAVRLRDGRIVINTDVRDRQRAGLPLHLLGQDGTLLGSFGSERPILLPGQPIRTIRWLWSSDGVRIWSLPHAHSYLIELWDSTGRRELGLSVSSPWHPHYEVYLEPTPSRPPSPRLMGMWEDDHGRIWVIGHAHDPEWSEGLGRPVRSEGQLVYRVKDLQLVYDGVVDVLDPRSGRMLTTRRFDQTWDIVIGRGLVGGVREGADGWPYVDVFLFNLLAPSKDGL